MNKYDEAVEALQRMAIERLHASSFLSNRDQTDVCCLVWKGKESFCVLTATSTLASLLIRDIDHTMIFSVLDYSFGHARARKDPVSDNLMAQGAEAIEILDTIRVCETLFMEGDQG